MADEMSNAKEEVKRMSRLTCSQCEGMLLDAADDLLLPDERTHFDLHVSDCAACTKLFADVQRGHTWIDMLKEEPVPPAGMVDRILAATSGDAMVHQEVMSGLAHAQSLFGHSQGAKVLPFRVPEPRTRWARMVHTVMQPRFAMTAAMALFSIALTMNLAGVKLSAVSAADLKPSNVRKSFWSANGRVVRYYDNLRVVYELESRVREMQKESDDDNTQRHGVMSAPQDQQPQRQPSGQPRSFAPHRHPHDPKQSTQGYFRLVGAEHRSYQAAVETHGEGAQA